MTWWAEISTVVTGGVAVLALAGAIWQVLVARKSQREATASDLYAGYLACAVEHPKLASAYVDFPKDVTQAKPKQFNEEFERYEWFVSLMLHAFEQILDLTKNDPTWRTAIADQVGYHRDYIASSRFVPAHYSRELRDLFSRNPSRSSSDVTASATPRPDTVRPPTAG